MWISWIIIYNFIYKFIYSCLHLSNNKFIFTDFYYITQKSRCQFQSKNLVFITINLIMQRIRHVLFAFNYTMNYKLPIFLNDDLSLCSLLYLSISAIAYSLENPSLNDFSQILSNSLVLFSIE